MDPIEQHPPAATPSAELPLGTVAAALFVGAVGKQVRFSAPKAGREFAGVVLETVAERPRATPRGAKRTAFNMMVTVPDPGSFEQGLCDLDVPGVGRLADVFVQRVVSPSIEPGPAWFQIVFN